jgi:hypothetical protein
LKISLFTPANLSKRISTPQSYFFIRIHSENCFQVEKLEHDAQQQHAELAHLRTDRQAAISLALREKDEEVKLIFNLYCIYKSSSIIYKDFTYAPTA